MPIQTEKGVFGNDSKYTGVYSRLKEFPPKELLDRDITSIIEEIAEREGIETPKVAEVGAGPAPICSLLFDKDPNRYILAAFDINSEMQLGREYPFSYNSQFDLRDPNIPQELVGEFDFVVMENSLYATTISPNGRKYSEAEADLMRITALKKAASMLKEGGILILSDPLRSTQDFSPNRIIEFLKCEQKALMKLRGEKKSLVGIFSDKLSDKEMREILRINKKLMNKTVLLDENKMRELISSTDLFQHLPLMYDPQSYLGSNLTTVLRRNDKEIKMEESGELGHPIILQGQINENILHWIGEFRKKRYKETKATPNLPEVDEYDRKPEGIVLAYLSKNKLSLAATATLQERGQKGLDLEHLMIPEEGTFYSFLLKQIKQVSPKVKERVESGKQIKFGEIRRLATDSLSRKDFATFFRSMSDIFFTYSKRNKIDIVMYVTDERRAKLFDQASGNIKFQKVPGFHLNRSDPHLQSMMIPAYNYFFSDWKEKLSEEEIGLINEVTAMMHNGELWIDVIKNHPKEKEYSSAINSLFSKTSDNVGIYFTDYAMTN